MIISGKAGDDISGGQGADVAYGGDHDDVEVGGPGNDRLYGGNTRDTLIGGSGDDLLDTGLSPDIARGGTGTDTCLGAEREIACEAGVQVPRDLPKYPPHTVLLSGKPGQRATPIPTPPG